MPTMETKINRFSGGVTNNPRDPRENVATMVTDFDIFTRENTLLPYRNSEDGNSSQADLQIQNFAIALRTGTTYSLYGLGITTGTTNRAEVYYKNLTSNSTNDLSDATWTETVNNASAQNQTTFTHQLFVYYRRTNRIYGARGGTHIWAYDPSGTAAFEDTHFAVTYTNIGQGLVHSKDDVLYVPIDNKIYKNDNGAWSLALTLPEHFYVTAICEYGDQIGIAMAPLSGNGDSRVFIWDRDTSLTTLSETIPWEQGILRVIEVVDGYLVGIAEYGTSATAFKPKIIFRYLTGSKVEGYRAEKFLQIDSSSAGSFQTQLVSAKQIVEGRLHFMMRTALSNAQRDGVWSIGRHNREWVLSHERRPNNSTDIGSGGGSRNFIYVGDFLFQSFFNSSSILAMTKTDNTGNFTESCIWESKIFDGSHKGYDPSYYKSLKEVTVTHEPLTSTCTLTLQFRRDHNSSWNTIFSNTTANSISRTAVTGTVALPKEYKQIQFRILLANTGTDAIGITGLIFKEEITARKYDTI